MSFAVPRTPVGSPKGSLRPHGVLAAAVSAALAALATPISAAEPSLEEKILANKYRHGDYGVYVGWHDPVDWQFDEHGSNAVPIGVRVRWKWLGWLRIEGDLSYYRRSEDAAYVVSLATAPQLDALTLSSSVQWAPRRTGLLRPWVGGGPLMVSMGNDFLVYRPEIHDVDPANPDQFAMANWSEFDFGVQVEGGVDMFLGGRVMPFGSFRYQFGQLTLDDEEVTIGGISLPHLQTTLEELHTIPADPSTSDGKPHSHLYDWSGPSVMLGLKVLF
jgi:hypothetical protein